MNYIFENKKRPKSLLYQGFEPLLVDDLWGIRTHDPFPVKEVLSHWANKSYVNQAF